MQRELAPVGHDALTDAPNSVSEFGWRKPHPRRTPPRGPVDRPGVPGNPGGQSTPIFFLVSPKKKTAVEPSKEKTLFAAQLRARSAPCRAAGCGSELFCSVIVASAGTRAGLSSDFRTFCAVLHNSLVGQKLNLTSYYPRALRFAKRCPGGRGGSPPRSVGADDHIGPPLGLR